MSNTKLNIVQNDCFTAFLDILGFSDLLMKRKGSEEVSHLFQTVLDAAGTAKKNSEVRIIGISDSLIIYVDGQAEKTYLNFPALRRLLVACREIQKACALKNFWIRGGVSYGQVWEIEQGEGQRNIFGRPIVDAYRAEQQAKFPRVVISAAVIKAVGSDHRRIFIGSVNRHEKNDIKSDLVYDWLRKTEKNFESKDSSPISPEYPEEDVTTFVDFLSDLDGDEAQELADNVKKNLRDLDGSSFLKHLWTKKYLCASIARSKNIESDAKFNILTRLVGF